MLGQQGGGGTAQVRGKDVVSASYGQRLMNGPADIAALRLARMRLVALASVYIFEDSDNLIVAGRSYQPLNPLQDYPLVIGSRSA